MQYFLKKIPDAKLRAWNIEESHRVIKNAFGFQAYVCKYSK